MPYLSRTFMVAGENRWTEKPISSKYTEARFREAAVRGGCDPTWDTDRMLRAMREAGNVIREVEPETLPTPEEEAQRRAE